MVCYFVLGLFNSDSVCGLNQNNPMLFGSAVPMENVVALMML